MDQAPPVKVTGQAVGKVSSSHARHGTVRHEHPSESQPRGMSIQDCDNPMRKFQHASADCHCGDLDIQELMYIHRYACMLSLTASTH